MAETCTPTGNQHGSGTEIEYTSILHQKTKEKLVHYDGRGRGRFATGGEKALNLSARTVGSRSKSFEGT